MINPKAITSDGYIINQSLLSNIKYGKYTSDYNGCGWISAYNSLISLGKSPKYTEVISDLQNHSIFNGLFGTNPLYFNKYFSQKGYKVKINLCKKKFNAAASSCTTNIILYFHSKGAHFVSFKSLGNGKYHFYNDIYGKEDDIRTMDQFLDQTGFLPAMLISIS